MSYNVFDTKFVASANGDLAARKTGNALDRRLRPIEHCVITRSDIRVSPKLRREYGDKIREARNNIIALFIQLLDDASATTCSDRSKLSTAEYAVARKIRWPSHDQHLLAAAMGGSPGRIYSTESAHGKLAAKVKREFDVEVFCIDR